VALPKFSYNSNYDQKILAYLLVVHLVADVVARGCVAVRRGVRQVSVRALVGALVVRVRESVLAPVAVKHFGLVSVLVHICYK
jgi:hypothetical protein